MNTCERFSKSFSDYVENSVSSAQREALQAHLAQCASCQSTVARLQTLNQRLHHLAPVTCPPDFEAMLRARIKLDHRAMRPSFFFGGRLTLPRFAGLAAAGLAVVMSLSFLWRENLRRDEVFPRVSLERELQSPVLQAYSSLFPAKISFTLDKITPGHWQMRKGFLQRLAASDLDSLHINSAQFPVGPYNASASISTF